MTWEATQHWWWGRRFVRCAIDALVRSGARRLLAELDRVPLDRIQARTLTQLVRLAQKTHFGRDHDFCRIRDVADFRRLVPVCTPLDLWQAYWAPAYPNLKGVTWPGAVTCLATASSCSRPVPITAETWTTQRSALWTAVALACQARPRARMFEGQFLFLGDQTSWNSPDTPTPTNDLDGIALRHFPTVLRPYLLGLSAQGRRADADALEELATHSQARPITAIASESSRLLRFFTAVKRASGRDDLRELWPGLDVVLFTRKPSGPERTQLAEELATRSGDVPILLQEAAIRPEGTLAVEDPRHGLLRLLPHHGIFFEFVPVSEVHQPRPTRHGVGDVELGIPYAVAVTSPAGLWACLTGWTVCFECRDPPLLRVISSAVTRAPGTRVDPAAFPFAVQQPHVRSGTGATLPAASLQRKIS